MCAASGVMVLAGHRPSALRSDMPRHAPPTTSLSPTSVSLYTGALLSSFDGGKTTRDAPADDQDSAVQSVLNGRRFHGAHPQLVKSGDVLTGVNTMASCGHSARHQQQITQSWGYLTTAFLLPLSILITSAGQLSTHLLQPLHSLESIRSIAIMLASSRFQRFSIAYSPGNRRGYLCSCRSLFCPLQALDLSFVSVRRDMEAGYQ